MQNEKTEGAPLTGGPVDRSVRPVAEVTGTAAGTTFVMSLTDRVLISGMKLYDEYEIHRLQRRIFDVESELRRVQETILESLRETDQREPIGALGELAADEIARLRSALNAIEQRAADNMDDRETVYALHRMASNALKPNA